MKHLIGKLIAGIWILVFQVHLASAQNGLGLTLNAGINDSDMQYGEELVSNLLPREDYLFLTSGGMGAKLYTLGVGIEMPIFKSLYAVTRINYSALRYKVEGEVRDPKPPVIGPPSPTIITSANGDLDYHMMEINAGVSFHLNEDPRRGLFGTILISHFIHLGRTWDLEVQYENGLEDVLTGKPAFDNTEYQNLWMAGAEIGINVPMTSWLSLAPKFGFHLGLNPVAEGTINPSYSTGSIQLSSWF